jgi:hypothetical protein
MSGDLFERVRAIPIHQVIREYYPTLELKRSGHDPYLPLPLAINRFEASISSISG